MLNQDKEIDEIIENIRAKGWKVYIETISDLNPHPELKITVRKSAVAYTSSGKSNIKQALLSCLEALESHGKPTRS